MTVIQSTDYDKYSKALDNLRQTVMQGLHEPVRNQCNVLKHSLINDLDTLKLSAYERIDHPFFKMVSILSDVQEAMNFDRRTAHQCVIDAIEILNFEIEIAWMIK